MRLAISNIAWDAAEDDAVALLLHRHGIDAIDIAPGKYFPEPAKALDEDIARVRNWWRDRGIEIFGMQALLFNDRPQPFRATRCAGRDAAASLRPVAASAQVSAPDNWYSARHGIGIAAV